MADYGEDTSYLLPDFEPTTLTIPRLRSILVAHEVYYPSSAKKGDLVEIFNANVKPKAKRILSARGRVKRSARGIEDVESSVEPSVDGDAGANGASDGVDGDSDVEMRDDDADEVRHFSPPDTVRRTSRRAPRASTVESLDGSTEYETPAPRQPKRVTSVRTSRKSDTESANERTSVRSPIRSTRKSMATPAVKQEDAEEQATMRRGGHESPFTSDNPFQSGGTSPSLGPLTVNGDKRRVTMGIDLSKADSKRTSTRRRTDFPTPRTSTNGKALSPSRRSEQAVVPVKRAPVEDFETEQEEAGEEFTPEEQAELTQEREQYGAVAVRPAKRRRSSRSSSSIVKVAPWAVSLAMLGGLSTVWRQEKLEVGFCGVGRQTTSALGGVQIPNWASFVKLECEPCPPHAYCYQHLQASCETGFMLVPHPLSLGGLVPLPPTCEPDSEKAQKVKAVADRAVEQLRERNAKWECGELRDAQGKKAIRPELKEPELKAQVESKKRKSMSQEEFEELWAAAIGEVVGRDEIESGVDGTTSHRTLRSTSLARVPLSCAIRRSLRLALARHLRVLVLIILALLSLFYTRSLILSRQSTEARAKHLASLALQRLARQAALHARDAVRIPEPWISAVQLRDDVLRDEFEPGRRRKLWEVVQRKVEGNANVRSLVREGRSGEVGRCWEWIGAVDVDAIEEGGGSGTPRTALRFGYAGTPSPGGLVKREEDSVVGKRIVEGRWDGERPIY